MSKCRTSRPRPLLAVLTAAGVVLSTWASQAHAQNAKPKPPAKKPPAAAPATSTVSPGSKSTPPKGEGEGGVKAYRFEELEIEGRLKSPQIVYFLRRVRAEFAAGDLGHRSFFPELSDSRNDSNL